MQSRLEQAASIVQAPPLLDESTFQKILQAVYVLQQEGDLQRYLGIDSEIKVPGGDRDTVTSLIFGTQDCSAEIGAWRPESTPQPEPEWRHLFAAERATMLEVLERIKPQLERLARAGSA
jgi:hypothetical protein